MYFSSFFFELKIRFFLLVITCGIVVFVSFFFKEVLLSIFLICCGDKVPSFIFTNVTEIFSVYVFIVFFFANQVLILFFLYHLALFILPSLTVFEFNVFVYFYKLSYLFFVVSFFVFFLFLFPLSWDFFLSFQSFHLVKSFSMDFEAKLLDYCLFFEKFYLICVMYFQIFLLPALFFKYIKKDLYFRFRKVFYFCCVVFATTVTPPDVLSQVCLSLFIIIGCEFLVYYFIIKNILTV